MPTFHTKSREDNNYEIWTLEKPFTSFHFISSRGDHKDPRNACSSFECDRDRNPDRFSSEPENETGVPREAESTPNISTTCQSFFRPDVSKCLILSHSSAADLSFSQKTKARSVTLPSKSGCVSFSNISMGVPQHCRLTPPDTTLNISLFLRSLDFIAQDC